MIIIIIILCDKSMDWFLCDNGLHHERVNITFFNICQSKIPNVTRGPFIRENMLHVRRHPKTLNNVQVERPSYQKHLGKILNENSISNNILIVLFQKLTKVYL